MTMAARKAEFGAKQPYKMSFTSGGFFLSECIDLAASCPSSNDLEQWACPIGRVPAGEIEAAVIDQLRAVFRQPEIVAGTWKAARSHADDITEADARAALQQLDPLWDELFPAEQARIVGLAVGRVDIAVDSINARLRLDGLSGLAREMLAGDVGVAA